MPNDAKLGLVVGVGLVVALAVIFTRKDAPAAAGPTAAAVRNGEPAVNGARASQTKVTGNPRTATGTPPRPYRPEYEFVSETQPAGSR